MRATKVEQCYRTGADRVGRPVEGLPAIKQCGVHRTGQMVDCRLNSSKHVKIRDATLHSQKHVRPMQAIKSVGKVQFHNDMVSRQRLKVPTSRVNGSFTTTWGTDSICSNDVCSAPNSQRTSKQRLDDNDKKLVQICLYCLKCTKFGHMILRKII